MKHAGTGPRDERERLEALVCAYVLGELEPREQAEVEAALAASAELRAQRDELQRTIGCVRQSFDEDERLSGAATRELLARVRTERADGLPAWARSPSARIAASFLLVVGISLAYRSGRGTPGWDVARGRASEGQALGRDASSRARSAPVEARPFGDGPVGGEAVADVDADKGEETADDGAKTADDATTLAIADELRAAMEELGSVEDDDAAEPVPVPAGRSESLAEARPPVEPRPDPVESRRVAGRGGRPVDDGFDLRGDGGEAIAQEIRDEPTAQPPRARARFERQHDDGAREAPASDVESAQGAASAPDLSSSFVARADAPASEALPAERPAPRLRQRGSTPSAPRGAPQESPPARGRGRARFALGGELAPAPGDVPVGGGRVRSGETFALESLGLEPRSPAEREALCDRLIASCRRRPNERPRDMFFRFWGDHPFELVSVDPRSTFSIDVDTASYALTRALLNDGYLPPKEAVRTEEFLNAFEPDVAPPVESTFRVETELAPARYGSPLEGDLWNLRVAIRGRELPPAERRPLVLTFVVDVSGSMREGERLELVKHALRLLVAQLGPDDALAIVAFSREARLILPMTFVRSRDLIESAIHPLSPDGGTNAEAGLKLGYQVAAASFAESVENRVVFLSDGVANLGQTDQDQIVRDVRFQRERGIYLNTIGVGLANHDDVFLEQLADRGDGRCDYIDSPHAARKALVENFVGHFQAIARDVKVQVEFDPRRVWKYRLLGYENRALADADFENDAVDAGEVGAGHQVVALYEIALHSIVEPHGDPQGPPLASVRLRWKPPHGAEHGDRSVELDHAVRLAEAHDDFEGASFGFRRSVLVAQFAEFLRRSVHARGDSFEDLATETEALAREGGTDELAELADLVLRARALVAAEARGYDPLERALDLYRRNCWLLERQRFTEDVGAERLDEMERLNRQMEDDLRELVLEELDR